MRSALSGGVTVTGLVTRANGELFVSGRFGSAGGVGANNVALWDGATWSTLGAGLLGQTIYGGWLASADELPNGDIVVGLTQPTLGPFLGFVHRWDGATWAQYGPPIGELGVQVLSMPGGLVAGSTQLGQFDGNVWQPIDGSGATYAQVRAIAELPNGDVVVGGSISMLNGTAVSNIALWNGSSWSSMAGGIDGQVYHLAVAPSGDLIAAELKERSPQYNNGKKVNIINQKLGYLVRCGDPDAIDSIVPMAYGNLALDLILKGNHGRLITLRNGRYDNAPIDVVTSTKKVVDVNRYYNADRLRPHYHTFEYQPLFIMTSN